MGSTPISTACLLTCLAAVALLEVLIAAVGIRMALPRLWLLAATRTVQIIAVIAVSGVLCGGGLAALGLTRPALLPGIKKGLIWSGAFAIAAGLLFFILALTGHDPLTLIRSPLPVEFPQRALFFAVGGILAPIAEELVFRGLIFGYLRRWGLTAAVVISTALFAAIHLGPAIPVTQLVGGVVFAIAYHTGRSLMVPIVIHMLGNLAIFTLSLPLFH